MKFTRAKWKNLFSYGDEYTEIALDADGITFVRGVNKDTNTSNGSGKSSIIDIFTWTLFGKPLKDIPIDSVKNNHTRGSGHGAVEFWVGSDFYEIERFRKDREYGNGVRIKKNSVEMENATPRDAQTRIDSILGLDYQAFISSLIFSSEITFAFPRLKPDKRREYIEQIMGLQSFSEYGKDAKKQVRAIRKGLDALEVSLKEKQNFIKSEVADYETYTTKHENFDVEKANVIKELEESLIPLETKIKECDPTKRDEVEAQAEDVTAQIDALVNQSHELQLFLTEQRAEFAALEKHHKQFHDEWERDYSTLDKELTKELKTIDKKLKLLEHSCPTCERDWDAKEVEELSTKYNGSKEALNTTVGEKKQIMEATRDDETARQETELESARQELSATESNSEGIQQEIETLKAALGGYQDLLTTLPTKEFLDNLITRRDDLADQITNKKNEKSPYLEVLQRLQEKIEGLVENVNGLKEERTEQEEDLKYKSFWDESFNSDGLKLFIFENVVPVLNSRISHYIPLLFDGKDITLDFDKYLNMQIVKEQKSIPYGALSQGERKRIDLAISLALLETAQAQHGISANLMFFDEIFDSSLDSQGVRTVTEILHTMPVETVFVISHRLEISDSFDNTLDVVKEGKFSTILTQ
jgi:DNA repair exonuclease SbcCD ATPase subunit